MGRRYDEDAKYVDSGKRTKDPRSFGNLILDHFDRLQGKTFEQVSNEIIASSWRPPESKKYETLEDKKKHIRGYLIDRVREGYLLEVFENH